MKKNITIIILTIALGHFASVDYVRKKRNIQIVGLIENFISALESYEDANKIGVIGSIKKIKEGFDGKDSTRTNKEFSRTMGR